MEHKLFTLLFLARLYGGLRFWMLYVHPYHYYDHYSSIHRPPPPPPRAFIRHPPPPRYIEPNRHFIYILKGSQRYHKKSSHRYGMHDRWNHH